MTLDSAVRPREAPAGHHLAALHGHTYTLRLHLAAPLDAAGLDGGLWRCEDAL